LHEFLLSQSEVLYIAPNKEVDYLPSQSREDISMMND